VVRVAAAAAVAAAECACDFDRKPA